MKVLNGYLTDKELAKQLGKSPRALALWRQHRKGPPWTTIGRKIVYRREAVLEWLRSQEVEPVRSRRR